MLSNLYNPWICLDNHWIYIHRNSAAGKRCSNKHLWLPMRFRPALYTPRFVYLELPTNTPDYLQMPTKRGGKLSDDGE